jgi:hypothetical protein
MDSYLGPLVCFTGLHIYFYCFLLKVDLQYYLMTSGGTVVESNSGLHTDGREWQKELCRA